MVKKLEINVNSLEQSGKRFINAWHQAKNSISELKTQECLTFTRLEDLWKVLTPRRLELLKLLHNTGDMSIRALSKLLERDYSNVHADVQELIDFGLIEKNKNDKILVPWDEVIAHFPLTVNSDKRTLRPPLKAERKAKKRGTLHPKKPNNHRSLNRKAS